MVASNSTHARVAYNSAAFAALTRFFDVSSEGVRLFDGNAIVIYENAALRRLVENAYDGSRIIAVVTEVARAAQRNSASRDLPDAARRDLDTGTCRYVVHATAIPPGVLAPDQVIIASIVCSTPAVTSIDALARDCGLTPRQVDVVRGLARGQSNRAIAAALDLSVHTVRRHVERIFGRLGMHSRAQIAAWVARLVPESDGGRLGAA